MKALLTRHRLAIALLAIFFNLVIAGCYGPHYRSVEVKRLFGPQAEHALLMGTKEICVMVTFNGFYISGRDLPCPTPFICNHTAKIMAGIARSLKDRTDIAFEQTTTPPYYREALISQVEKILKSIPYPSRPYPSRDMLNTYPYTTYCGLLTGCDAMLLITLEAEIGLGDCMDSRVWAHVGPGVTSHVVHTVVVSEIIRASCNLLVNDKLVANFEVSKKLPDDVGYLIWGWDEFLGEMKAGLSKILRIIPNIASDKGL